MMQLQDVPLILCGPVVRRVDDQGAAVFVALRAPRQVTLTVYDDAGVAIVTGERDTVPIGRDLHVAVVAVRGALRWGATYEYDLTFAAGAATETLDAKGVLTLAGGDLSAITFAGKRRPSFVLPPREVSGLRVLHTSCRKPHGEGEDALAYAEAILAESLASPPTLIRPQQLFLTGDQIYADDVSGALLTALRDFARERIDPEEQEARIDLAAYAAQLEPGQRQALVQKTAGFTSGAAANHLVTLGEFYAAYLFAWSPLVWPETAQKDPQLQAFYQTLPRVRRLLANVATYMILDDHEITDDWYISRAWCDAVLASPLGRRILRNGLSAYAVFQHWGNEPGEYEGERPGARLLTVLSGWTGTEAKAAAVERHVYLPRAREPLAPTSADALRWSWRWQGPDYEVLALDTRTRRQFDGAGEASLMSVADIDAVVAPPRHGSFTLLLSAAPVLGVQLIEAAQRAARLFGFGNQVDDEPWGHSATYGHLLARLTERAPVAILSGDVHFGYGAILRERKSGRVVVNFVSSAAKNMDAALVRAFLFTEDSGTPLLQAVVAPLDALTALGLPGTREIITPAGVFEERLIGVAADPVASKLGPLGGVLKSERTRAPIVSRGHIGDVLWSGGDLVQVLWYRGQDPYELNAEARPDGFRQRRYPAHL